MDLIKQKYGMHQQSLISLSTLNPMEENGIEYISVSGYTHQMEPRLMMKERNLMAGALDLMN